ncbi:MAG: metallophosphoesterase family protein [Marinifilaceae bacterium]
MKRISLILILTALNVLGFAKKPILRYSTKGKFKIVQFTDLHIKPENPDTQMAIEAMNTILDEEKPDLVIFTGDIIWGQPALEAFERGLEPAVSRGIPFYVLFGNHDDEKGLSRQDLYNISMSKSGCCMQNVKGISGIGNGVVEILGSMDKDVANVLYCFDSHSYSKVKEVKGYDFIKFDQIKWYVDMSNRYAQKNDGKKVEALAFFHIPLPEYGIARKRKDAAIYGNAKEGECAPVLNSGLYTTMKQQGDVKGVFTGHDHDNDYIVDYNGIALAYGRFSGGNTVYFRLPMNGARVIELTENVSGFASWIRLRDRSIEQRTVFPDSFNK